MIAMYFSLVVVYFFIGYLFLPDEMCSTGFCFFGSLQFPPVVFIVTGILIRKGTIKAPPVSNTTPPEPEEGAKKPSLPVVVSVAPTPSTPYKILCFHTWNAKLSRMKLWVIASYRMSSTRACCTTLSTKAGACTSRSFGS